MKINSPTRTAASVLALTTMTLATTAVGSSGAEAADSLRVATLVGISSLPIQVGIEQGFFEEHGIDVELTGGNDVAAWQTAVGRQFDLVLTNPFTYTMAAAEGLDNVLVNSMVSATADYPLNTLAAEEPIEDLADLRGATIGVASLTGLSAQTLQYVLAEAGVESSEYDLVAMPFNVHGDNLRAGNVDAVATAQPYLVVLQNDGFWVDPDDLSVQAVSSITDGELDTFTNVSFVAASDWAAEHGSELDAWLAALGDAIEFISEQPDEALAILQEWVGYPDELAAAVVLPAYSLPVEGAQLESAWNILVANGSVEGEYPADNVHVRDGD